MKKWGIQVGEEFVNGDCSEKYSCSAPLAPVAVKSFRPCAEDAVCGFTTGQNPICQCDNDFVGDGYNCTGFLLIFVLIQKMSKNS